LIDDLGENSLAKIHPSLSEIRVVPDGDGRQQIPRKAIQIEKSSNKA
jgi:hypothetical protein